MIILGFYGIPHRMTFGQQCSDLTDVVRYSHRNSGMFADGTGGLLGGLGYMIRRRTRWRCGLPCQFKIFFCKNQ